ncbi:MAG TPA: hypothetical protein VK853_11620 [Ilumatobacteraceae bacterium]|nr:hypothetical protein [Ilumatobacteraceae bacterium]
MRTSTLIGGIAGLAASMILVLPPPANGAPGDTTGSVYSDLVVALRTPDGLPIPAVFDVLQDDGSVAPEECVQPVSYIPLPLIPTPTPNPVDGQDVYLIPLMGETLDGAVADPAVISVCDPQPNYAMYVVEAALERLNLARTADEVLERKLDEIEIRLITADEIGLDGAGRITTDGVAIDASPDYAAIYWSLMRTGTIPGLNSPPAEIAVPGGEFDTWMLAASAIGTAASKSVPITIDTVQYYNRVIGAVDDPDAVPPLVTWAPEFPDSVDGELFVDYRNFRYTRADVFRGCTTWLDARTMTWKSGDILDVVPFVDIVKGATDETELTNVAGFAQLADDVRSMVDFIHYHDVIPGFQIDRVFARTCEKQVSWATMWQGVPQDLFQTDTVPVSTSALMPWIGTPVPRAQLEMIIDADADFTAPDQVVLDGQGGYTITLPSMVETLVPKRVADTRPGFSTADGLVAGTGLLPGGQMLEIPIAGRVGVPADATAVVANVTVAEPAMAGFVSVFPCGSWPGTSSLNYAAGEVVANEVIAKLSATGSICVYTMATTHVVVDAVGYLVPNVESIPAAGAVEFAVVDGNLVGTWPAGSFEVDKGDNLTTLFDLTVAAGAPVGEYTMTLNLVDLDGVADTATDVARVNVLAAEPTALWDSTAEYVALGSYFSMTARVFNPVTELAGASLRFTIVPPSDEPGLAATAYSEAVGMPLTLSGGNLVGVWALDDPLAADSDELATWFMNVADTSPTGIYTITVELVQGGVSLSSDSAEVIIVPAAEHGKQPPGVGD